MEQAIDLDYGDLTCRLSHPGYMAAIGALFGLTAPPVATCRVLELGCGTGFNLIAMSQSTPGGHFTGIDLSESQIRHGREVAQSVGAANVELHCQSITDFQPGDAKFDYIIVHGVYTWVPDPVRQAILRIISQCLAANGIAFVSYNTNPGWRLRGLVRDALRFAAKPSGQIPAARDGVDRLTASLVNPESIYSKTLKAEWDNARENPDYYLAHEHLLPENTPFYFEEFAGHAAAHNLRFLAESRLATNSFLQDKALRTQLSEGGGDIIRREQHLDWLVGRYFRQSLLCHANIELPEEPRTEALLALGIASMAEIITRNESTMHIRQQNGAEYELADIGFQSVLEQLHPNGEAPVRGTAMQAHSLAALETIGVDGHLRVPAFAAPMFAALLWSGCADGTWTLRADSPAMATTVSERPVACPVARRQAAIGATTVNRLHREVTLSAEERALIGLLDGSRTLADLARETAAEEASTRLLLERFAARGLLSA